MTDGNRKEVYSDVGCIVAFLFISISFAALSIHLYHISIAEDDDGPLVIKKKDNKQVSSQEKQETNKNNNNQDKKDNTKKTEIKELKESAKPFPFAQYKIRNAKSVEDVYRILDLIESEAMFSTDQFEKLTSIAKDVIPDLPQKENSKQENK